MGLQRSNFFSTVQGMGETLQLRVAFFLPDTQRELLAKAAFLAPGERGSEATLRDANGPAAAAILGLVTGGDSCALTLAGRTQAFLSHTLPKKQGESLPSGRMTSPCVIRTARVNTHSMPDYQ